MIPDIIYVVRPGERNEPLRYSLRSLANLPHRRVIVAGYCPKWLKNVTTVEVPRRANKFDSIEANLRAALEIPDLADEFVYMNDDFYVMEPIDHVEPMHGGPVSEYKSRHPELRKRMAATIDELDCYSTDPIRTYDGMHVPFLVDKVDLRLSMEIIPQGCLWRTFHGNMASVGGKLTGDVKSRDGKPVVGSFMSSSPATFKVLKPYLEDVLPRGNQYA